MKLEGELRRDVWIWKLLERQSDVEADRFSVSVGRAAIGRLHDARPAAGANHKTVCSVGKLLGPLCNHAGQFARVAIIDSKRAIFPQPCRSEEHHRVPDFLPSKLCEWFQ